MAGSPDPKPPKRVKDPKVARKARLSWDECAACERSDQPISCHHILYGADGRHDDRRNLLPLCGDGVAGCHGRMHHGHADTLAAIAAAIAARPEMIAFIKERLGVDRGLDYLRRRYGLDVGLGFTPDPKSEPKERKRR